MPQLPPHPTDNDPRAGTRRLTQTETITSVAPSMTYCVSSGERSSSETLISANGIVAPYFIFAPSRLSDRPASTPRRLQRTVTGMRCTTLLPMPW